MSIKAILTAHYSKRDRNGNCYWALVYRDCATGKTVTGTISGGESNIRATICELGMEYGEVHFTVEEHPIRVFNHMVKDYQYVGCHPFQIALNIVAALTNYSAIQLQLNKRAHVPFDTDKISAALILCGANDISVSDNYIQFSALSAKVGYDCHNGLDQVERYLNHSLQIKGGSPGFSENP